MRSAAIIASVWMLIGGFVTGVLTGGWLSSPDELNHDAPVPNTPVYGVVKVYRLAGQDTCRSFDTGHPVEVYGWMPDKP